MYLNPNRGYLAGLIVLVLAIHFWAIFSSGYFYIWWLDLLLHFLGGFILGTASISFLLPRLEIKNPRPLVLYFFIILGLVSLLGLLWEYFEFLIDFFFANRGIIPRSQLGLEDTLSDLLMDLLGGAFAHFLFIKHSRSTKNS